MSQNVPPRPGLSRVWIRLQGKNNYVTLLSAYRPCKLSTSGIRYMKEMLGSCR